MHTYVHTKETRVRTTSVTTTLISNSGFLVLSFSHLHFLSFSRSPHIHIHSRDDTWSHHSRTRIRTSGRVVNRPFSHERISLFSSRFVTHSMFLHFFLSLSHSLSLSLYFLLRYRFPFVALTHGIHTVNVEIKRKGTNKRTNRQAV